MSRYGRIVFPGSFDPLTNGHVDIVRRCLAFCDEVIVGVLENPAKGPLFTAAERVELIDKQFEELNGRVKGESFTGLLVDFLRERDVKVVVRGLRAISDYDYEAQMALMNNNLWPEVETLFLMAKEENSYVSSTLVKQVAPYHGDVSKLVPKVVEEALRAKF